MSRKTHDNIRDVGRGNRAGRKMIYLVCVLILIVCVLLDVYFILGIVG